MARRFALTPGNSFKSAEVPGDGPLHQERCKQAALVTQPHSHGKHRQVGAVLRVQHCRQHIWNLPDDAVLAETVTQSTHHCPILSCERFWRYCVESSNVGHLHQHEGLGCGVEMVRGGISFDRTKTSTRGTLTECLRDD